MVRLKRSWVKPGYYPLGNVSDLKWENTQEFHDQYINLKSTVHHALSTIQGYVNNNNDLNDNEQRPLYQWTDDDFNSFITASKLMHHDTDDDIKRRFKQLLLRDRMNGLKQVLVQLQSLAAVNESKFVGKKIQIERIAAQLKGSDVYIAQRLTDNGFDRMRQLSKLISNQTKRNNIRINLDTEIKQLNWKSLADKDDGASNSTRKEFKKCH